MKNIAFLCIFMLILLPVCKTNATSVLIKQKTWIHSEYKENIGSGIYVEEITNNSYDNIGVYDYMVFDLHEITTAAKLTLSEHISFSIVLITECTTDWAYGWEFHIAHFDSVGGTIVSTSLSIDSRNLDDVNGDGRVNISIANNFEVNNFLSFHNITGSVDSTHFAQLNIQYYNDLDSEAVINNNDGNNIVDNLIRDYGNYLYFVPILVGSGFLFLILLRKKNDNEKSIVQ